MGILLLQTVRNKVAVMKKIKVVEAISDSNLGGAGILLHRRLTHSDQNRFRTIVLCPEKSVLQQKIRSSKIKTVGIKFGADRSFHLLSVIEYICWLRKIRPDLVNCHGSLSCRIAAKLCGVPVKVCTKHCVFPLTSWQKTAFSRIMTKNIQYFLSNQIIAVAYAAKRDLIQRGTNKDQIQVIINGAEGLKRDSLQKKRELKQSLHFPEDSVVVGICARLEPYKGHRDFLLAAKHLLSKSSKYRFLIVGEGSARQSIYDFCAHLGLLPYTCFTGFVNDVTPYYNIMDINVNCSCGTETSSLALSEGMSLGIPSVVSNYGGNPYMIQHGRNGFIYPSGDYRMLADYIHRLIQDEVLYRKASLASYERFERELNIVRMTRETEALYIKLIKQRL